MEGFAKGPGAASVDPASRSLANATAAARMLRHVVPSSKCTLHGSGGGGGGGG